MLVSLSILKGSEHQHSLPFLVKLCNPMKVNKPLFQFGAVSKVPSMESRGERKPDNSLLRELNKNSVQSKEKGTEMFYHFLLQALYTSGRNYSKYTEEKLSKNYTANHATSANIMLLCLVPKQHHNPPPLVE